MKTVPVKFTVLRQEPVDKKNPNGEKHLVAYDFEGTLVGFGTDAGKDGGTWSTGIVITGDGSFNNVPVERLKLAKPFKEEDWE